MDNSLYVYAGAERSVDDTWVYSDRVGALTLRAICNRNPLRLNTVALAEQIIENCGEQTESFAARGDAERNAVVCFNFIPQYLYMELPFFWNDNCELTPLQIINQVFDRNLSRAHIAERPEALSVLLG